MEKIPVLVTGVGGRSVGYQIVACLQKFPKRYQIITTDVYGFSAGSFKANKAYLAPFAPDKKYIEKILEIAIKEKVRAIIPGSPAEVVKIAQSEDLFTSNGIIPITNRKELVETFANKISQYRFLQDCGFEMPKFLSISKELPKRIPFDFPAIAKPVKDHGGSRNVYIIADFKELEAIFKLTKKTRTEMFLQEYIGSPEDEYTVGVVSDSDGNVIDAIVMRRVLLGLSLLAQRTINGKVYAISSGLSQGIFIRNNDIKNYCIKVARTIRSAGPLNIQLRMTSEGPRIFEINARFSGSASQRAAVGFNEPDVLIRNFCFGEKITTINHNLDIGVIRHVENIIVAKKQLDKFAKKGFLDHKASRKL